MPATPAYLRVQLGQLLLVQVGLLIHALLVSELRRNGNRRRGACEYVTRCSKETQPRLSGCAGGWGPRQQTPPMSGEPTASLPQTPHVTGITPAKVRGHVAGKTQEHPGAWGHPSLSRRSHGRCASRGWRSSSSRPRAWSRQQTRMCLPHPALGSPDWQSRCPCCHPGTLGDICSLKSSTSSELDMNYFTLTRSVPKRNVWVSVCLEAQHPYLVPGPRARTPLRADVGEPRLKSGEGQPLARARIPG